MDPASRELPLWLQVGLQVQVGGVSVGSKLVAVSGYCSYVAVKVASTDVRKLEI